MDIGMRRFPIPFIRRHFSFEAVLAGLFLFGAGCSGPATVPIALAEYDSILLAPRKGDPGELLDYSLEAKRYPWGVRLLEGSGLDHAWFALSKSKLHPWKVKKPFSFAFCRLLVMEKASQPEEIQAVSLRLFLTVLKDPWELNRSVALNILGRLALKVGPGTPPKPLPRGILPTMPDLGPAFRKKLTAQSLRNEWGAFQETLGSILLIAMLDLSSQVRSEALATAYDLWGARGLQTAMISYGLTLRSENDLDVMKRAARLCAGISFEDADDRTLGSSILDILEKYIFQVGLPFSPPLEMVAKHSITSILGMEPRYDTDWFKRWGRDRSKKAHPGNGGTKKGKGAL